MTVDLGRRQFFAEEVAAVANLKTPLLVEALASLPREKFLRSGPWLVRGEADIFGARMTADAAVDRVYHNYSIAIDPVPWVDLRLGDATGPAGEPFDAILVSAGVTHPQRAWLDALVLGGRMVLSLSATMPAMGPIGKGFSAVFTKTDRDSYSARVCWR